MSFRFAAKLEKLQKGETSAVRIEDEVILLVRTVNDEVFAVENCCSHEGGGLDGGVLKDRTLTCPRHGATFDVSSGKALTMPAVAPIQTYSVKTIDDVVEIDIEDE
jgi:3-phenylpropionate/trans-cinnamate dioxygenase ferredoxin subunit